ncbi:MAG: NnrS family protein [Enterobacterales bacterium]|nr:NnrS family protein [Enterobacterales bacterium]
MPLNQPQDSNNQPLALFTLAFRPLFLAASFFAMVAISWWTVYWIHPFSWSPYGGAIWWHAHEMLFGFGVAVVTGFLLTAAKNWTGVPGVNGPWLAGLVSVWIAGRLMMALPQFFSPKLVIAVDLSYLLLCAIAMAYPILKVRQWRNILFVPILLILAGLNATSHWASSHGKPAMALHALHATVMLFILIISVIGGRVIPMFTANTTAKPRQAVLFWLEASTIFSTAILVIIAFIGFDQVNSRLTTAVALVAAIAHFIRLSRWGGLSTSSVPLLWSLHLSYLFIPIGFILLALYALDLLDDLSAGLHCFTLGAIGGMILSMMSRVALGHTGRPLITRSIVTISFSLILTAAVIRVVIPIWFAQYYHWGIAMAGSLWVVSYAIYFYVYAPMLISPRADGRAS